MKRLSLDKSLLMFLVMYYSCEVWIHLYFISGMLEYPHLSYLGRIFITHYLLLKYNYSDDQQNHV